MEYYDIEDDQELILSDNSVLPTDETDMLKCNKCDIYFVTVSTFNNHIEQFHSGDEKSCLGKSRVNAVCMYNPNFYILFGQIRPSCQELPQNMYIRL